MSCEPVDPWLEMNPDRHEQINEVFQSAVDLSPGRRGIFLEEACKGDPELRAEVESLLSAHEEAGDFIEDSASDVAASLLGKSQRRPAQVRQYKIERLLGAGGMGEVFLAHDTRLNRPVALKMLSTHLINDEERVRRFRREALAASALNHPNILTIYEIEDEGERPYIATEYVGGVTLRTLMRSKRLSLIDALDIALQIGGALAAAHKAGVVHRDIKPENVIVRPDGLVKVLDFGIAKFTEPAHARGSKDSWVRTATGVIVGTAAYMSTEQARGEKIDARTDIWSLGVILYEMIARRLPFPGKTQADRVAAILEREPEPLGKLRRDVPAGLERIVSHALAKDRDARYTRAADLVKDLHELRAKLGDERQRGFSLPRLVQGIPRLSNRQAAVATALLAILMTIGLVGYLLSAGGRDDVKQQAATTQGGVAIDSLAVLPLVNVGGSADTDYLSDGMTESFINSLSQLPNLKVMSRNSVFPYKGREIDANAVASALHVQALLLGRVVQRGDDLFVSVELVDGRDNSHVWGGQYSRKMAEIVALQNEIARDVSRKLRARLSGADEQRVVKNYTENAAAYELYLKGRYYLNKLTPPEVQRSVSYFQQAIDVDPSYALAYVGLADAYSALALSVDMPATEFYPKAKAAAQRAIEIDDRLAEAHTSLGFAIQFYDWDWNAAENQYKRALELNPNSADAHFAYASLFTVVGKYAEALGEIAHARELDPLNLRTSTLEGRFLALAGRTDEGLARLQKTVELEPNYFLAHLFASNIYMEKGMYREGIAEATRARDLSGGNAEAVAWIGYGLARSGRRNEAQAVLDELKKRATVRYVPPYNFALIYNGLGEREETLAWLERGVEQRDPKMIFLKGGPQWHNLRGNSRFADLLQRMNLTP